MIPYTEQVLTKECSDCVEQFALIREVIDKASFGQVITEECDDCVKQFVLIQEVIGEASFNKVKKLSCHVLCMAVGELFDLKVEHGYYMPGFEHSWCVDRYGNIIDVYPWGVIGGPILIAKIVAYCMRLNGLYRVNDNLAVLKEPQTKEDADMARAEIAQLLELHKAT